ncbi:hypothetical protein ACE193_07740 [Bernardetia sp. OM2101]|uniref:hypothetical protein n=1 Tax=Bernardetia sp. OM2101 TaxID=3344876 RepID=UPI0035CFC658
MKKVYLTSFLALLITILYFGFIVPYYHSKYDCNYTAPLGTSSMPDKSRMEYKSNKLQDSITNIILAENEIILDSLIEKSKNQSYTTTMLVSSFQIETTIISLSNYIVKESLKFVRKDKNISVFKTDFYLCTAITKYNSFYPFGDHCKIYTVKINGLMYTELNPRLILNVYKGLDLEYTDDNIGLENY